MSKFPGIPEVLALLDELKSTVTDFAARERKIEQDFREKSAAARKHLQEDIAELEEALAAEIRALETAWQADRQKIRNGHEQRKNRIRDAHRNSRKRALERIDQHEGQRKYDLQKTQLDATRAHDDGLVNAEAAYAQFSSQLAENRAGFEALEADAQRAFGGYRRFLKLLAKPPQTPAPDAAKDEYQLLDELTQLYAQTKAELSRFRKRPAPFFFRALPPWFIFPLLAAGLALSVLTQRGDPLALKNIFELLKITPAQAIVGFASALVLTLAAYFLGRRSGAAPALALAQKLEKARQAHNLGLEKSAARRVREIERIEKEFADTKQMVAENWEATLKEAEDLRESWPRHLEEKFTRASATNDAQLQQRLERRQREHEAEARGRRERMEARRQALQSACDGRLAALSAAHEASWQRLTDEWHRRLQPLTEALQAAQKAEEALFPPWKRELWENWRPPTEFLNVVRFARLETDLKRLCEAVPVSPRLAFPLSGSFGLPLALSYPDHGSILFETTKMGGDDVVGALNNIILRLFTIFPAGKLSLTIIDPVKLGQNFAGVMHLADYEENLINGRIWTQTQQIEQHLTDLNEHMEKVIQMYLRNEYETIAEYNAQAGNLAEKYHFVVVADFPANFSDAAARSLLRIAASGARCGIYTLIHWDHRHTPPQDFVPAELRKSSLCLTCHGDHYRLVNQYRPGTRLVLDAPPDPEFATEFLHRVGKCSVGSTRVEVPFAQVAPAETERWTVETSEELRVPIGRTGAAKLQYLAIGKGTRQHALVAGKTGSGKSTLFHVIITNLALWCRPEQVEFYLVDFKKGVEFKCYATWRLPHARVVAIESDREFGLSVLQRVDDELKRRGDLFRKLGVQDIPGYLRAGGAEPMPRCLLLIDEFQEFFVEDDQISQTAAVLLDRIVRQGRAFGIHAMLGSQTLGGAYTLARTTMGQMVIRIALQCNEADAYLIMDENNAAPRLLSRPGEGIYNDSAGTIEGNSPFQTVWLPDDERDAALEQVRTIAGPISKYPGPIVFEGNAPADVRENHLLRALLEAGSWTPATLPRAWLGAPNSIKGPTEAAFRRQSGNNLLMVGQREEAVLAIVSVALISLAAQYRPGQLRLIVLESFAPGSTEKAWIERVVRAIPHETLLARTHELDGVLAKLAGELKERLEGEPATADRTTFLFIIGLQNFKKLRQDDDFSFGLGGGDEAGNAAANLSKVASEGASLGYHVVASVDTYNNVNRFLGRKALTEFEMRVLFQMSANDSASLCDNPKASGLGLHRALFYNEQEGYLETFRPYALPAAEWVEEAGRNLARLAGSATPPTPAAP